MRFTSMTRRNRRRALGALLLTMAVGAVAPAAQADAAYVIKPRHSGKCLDVAGESKLDGARLIQWHCLDNHYNQQFSFVPTDSGYVQIVARHSGKCLDVKDASTASYTPIWQWTCHVGFWPHQQFLLRSTGDGYYNIIARHSGSALDVQNVDTADGAPVIQHGITGVGGANQQFSIQWVP
jgi:hypothetical protein